MKRYFNLTTFLAAGSWMALLVILWLAVWQNVSGPPMQAVAILFAILFFQPLLAVPVILADIGISQRGLIFSFFADLLFFSLALLIALTPLHWHDALAAGAVLSSWTLAVIGLASALRFLSRGFASAISVSLHSICFFALIIAPPIFRNIPVAWHDTGARIVGWICPGLILQESTRNTLNFSWTQMDAMYTLTTFNQDVPLPIPTWWHAAIAYAGTGVVLLAVGWGVGKCGNVKM